MNHRYKKNNSKYILLLLCLVVGLFVLPERGKAGQTSKSGFRSVMHTPIKDVLNIPQNPRAFTAILKYDDTYAPALVPQIDHFKRAFWAPWNSGPNYKFDFIELIEGLSSLPVHTEFRPSSDLRQEREKEGAFVGLSPSAGFDARAQALVSEAFSAMPKYLRRCFSRGAKGTLRNSSGRKVSKAQSGVEEQLLRANIIGGRYIDADAVMIVPGDLRVLPTKFGFFESSGPFDELQQSYLRLGSPVRVVLATQDGKWLFVVANEYTVGWVEASDVAYLSGVEDDYKVQSAELVGFTKDAKVLIGGKSMNTPIGTVLPFARFEGDNIVALAPVAGQDGLVNWLEIQLDPNIAGLIPLEFNRTNVELLLDSMAHPRNRYSWGGHNGGRDCSMLTREFFMNFGLYLPRESIYQSNPLVASSIIEVGDLSDDDKLETIKKHALPFRTLLFLKGHIGLYIGTFSGGQFKDEPVMLHSYYGGSIIGPHESRGINVVDGVVTTTLIPGRELKFFNPSRSILKRIERLVIL